MFLKSLPFQLIVCLCFAMLAGHLLPIEIIRGTYTISVVFKELLLAFLPLVIFSYISTAILSLDKQAPFLIFAVIALVTLSNAVAIFISYGAGLNLLPYIQKGCGIYELTTSPQVKPYFDFSIPQVIGSDKMMLLALLFGFTFSFIKVPKVNALSTQLQQIITKLLVKGFIPFLPLYILGFALKMNYEGGLDLLFKYYSSIFMINCGVLSAYVFTGYMIGSGFKPKAAFAAIRNMLPAGLTGFSTMSSAVTMPVTLACTEKNLENPKYADLIIPTTANIHMMGDALSIPLLTFGVMQLCGQPLPNLQEFMLFVPAFCLAKFSLAAIPGGTIIVMLPVLQSHFHLSPETTSLITTLYILQDPIFTSGNVMGNGAFALISFRILKKLKLIR